MPFFDAVAELFTGDSPTRRRERQAAADRITEIREENEVRAAEAARQRDYEDAKIERERAEAKRDREERKLREEEKIAQVKAEAEFKRQEDERRFERERAERDSREKERIAEANRKQEALDKTLAQEREDRKRLEEIRRRDAEDAKERERVLIQDSHEREIGMLTAMQKLAIDAQKEKDEEVKRERETQQKMTEKQLLKMQDIHEKDRQESHARHDEMRGLMTEQLQIAKQQNDNLTKTLTDLISQFSQSRDDFLKYVEKAPQKDIVIPENMEETMRKAKEDLGLDTANCYNFAFVGQTKTGKSSLINAIRGLDDNHPDAAKVGITETTHKTTPYSFPDPIYKHVKIYDIPGAGTLTHNSDSYYHDKCLCAFDCLVILTQDTLGKAEIDFAIQSLRYNQPIAFVRSRCDIVLYNAIIKREIKIIDQNAVHSYISNMSEFFIEEIQRAGKPELNKVPCFFVSAHTLRDLIRKEEPVAVYHEHDFLDYIKTKSKYSRNIRN